MCAPPGQLTPRHLAPHLTRATHARSLRQVGFLTKMLMSFNAILTFYILNSQDRRFAQVDAQAKAALEQASGELRGSVTDALSFGKMFSGAFGGKVFGGSSPPPPPPPSGGGFQPNSLPEDGDGGQSWPTGGGGGA